MYNTFQPEEKVEQLEMIIKTSSPGIRRFIPLYIHYINMHIP